jgi:hypothetical protein
MVAAVNGQGPTDPVHREGLQVAQSKGMVAVKYLSPAEREEVIRKFEEARQQSCRQDPSCRPPGGVPLPIFRKPREYP